MGRKRVNSDLLPKDVDSPYSLPPAKLSEDREKQLIAAAVNLAEKQILDGTISSQNLNHFLRLSSPNAKLERQILESNLVLNQAKIESLRSSQRTEELYAQALAAMKEYSGAGGDESEDELE